MLSFLKYGLYKSKTYHFGVLEFLMSVKVDISLHLLYTTPQICQVNYRSDRSFDWCRLLFSTARHSRFAIPFMENGIYK